MDFKKTYIIYVLSFLMMVGILTGCGDDAYIDKGHTSTKSGSGGGDVNDTQPKPDPLTDSEKVLLQIGQEADGSATSTVTIVQLGQITPALQNIVSSNLQAYRNYIDANPNAFSSPATQAQVQAMINTVNAAQEKDTDGDGTPDGIDTDDDNDGFSDSDEALAGTDPLIATSKPTLPDYTPTLTLSKSDMRGAVDNTMVTIEVKELIAHGFNSDGTNVKAVRFSIVKNDKLVLTFNGDVASNNSEWELTETSSLYILKYIANEGKFKSSSTSKIVLNGVFTTPIASSGQYDLTVSLISGSGDVSSDNDRDSKVITYNNIQ